jgi:tight adherence protein B
MATLATLLLVVAGGREMVTRRRLQRRTRRVLEIEAARAAAGLGLGRGLIARFRALSPQQRASVALVVLAPALLLGASWKLSGVQGFVLAGAALIAAAWLTNRERARRQALLEKQLVPALRLMAASTESGFSVQQALGRAASELPSPIADELHQTVRLIALGVSLETALAELGARSGPNFRLFAHIVAVQYRIGGSLPSLLLGLATNVHDRLQFHAELSALTAQTRYSGWILGALPFGFLGLMALVSPDYIQVLFSTDTGRIILLLGVVVLAIGLMSIRAISQVEM